LFGSPPFTHGAVCGVPTLTSIPCSGYPSFNLRCSLNFVGESSASISGSPHTSGKLRLGLPVILFFPVCRSDLLVSDPPMIRTQRASPPFSLWQPEFYVALFFSVDGFFFFSYVKRLFWLRRASQPKQSLLDIGRLDTTCYFYIFRFSGHLTHFFRRILILSFDCSTRVVK